jgi:hypothetical protein
MLTSGQPARPNPAGRTSPLTVITPIKPWRSPRQRIVLEVLPQTPWGRSDDLLRLSFIQSARWALVTRLPWHGPPSEADRPRYDYLLFESNYNGSLDAYIEAFSTVMPNRMKRVWSSSFGFPGPEPVRPFLSYIKLNDFGADHFHSAYPNASNTDVLAALHLLPLVRRLSREATRLEGESFKAEYDVLLRCTQGRPEPMRPVDPPRGNLCGQTYAFTALTPIHPGRAEPLRRLLRQVSSPFASVPGLHFARWVVIDEPRYQGAGQRRDSWRRSYLLTSTTTDGAADPVDRLFDAAGLVLDEVFQHCVGYPGRLDPRSFGSYLRRHQIRTNRFFSGYPDASVDDVLLALDTHTRLLEFAHRHRDDRDIARLRRDFTAEFVPTGEGVTP